MKMTFKTILIFTLIAVLAGCQQATPAPTQEAATPASSATSASLPNTTGADPAPATPTAAPTDAVPANGSYPPPAAAGETNPPVQPGDNGGYPPPAAGVPAMENLSIVKATLIERGTDPAAPGFERLTVKILESAAAPGMISRTDDLIDAEIYLFAEPANLPDLQPGDTFTAEVAFRGDEAGERFFATKIEKQ